MSKKITLLDSLTPLTLIPSIDNTAGIYIGIDIISGRRIFWDLEATLTPHVLVVGPSGSGKTLTLSSLTHRFVKMYNANAIIFDIKDEYTQFLSIRDNVMLTFLNPLEESLPLCYCDDTSAKKLEMINIVVNSLSKVFTLSSISKRLLTKILTNLCTYCLDVDNLWNYEFDIYDKELSKIVNSLTTLFNVYPSHNINSKSINTITLQQGKMFVINLKQLFLRDKAESAAIILYTLNYLVSELSYSMKPIPRIIAVVDELWHAIPFIGDELVNMLVRYGRGLGLALFMATQGVDDLHPYTDTIVNSCGAFIAMSAPSISYWQRLQQYLNLSKKAVDYIMSVVSQGIAVARITPNKVPLALYVDPFDVV